MRLNSVCIKRCLSARKALVNSYSPHTNHPIYALYPSAHNPIHSITMHSTVANSSFSKLFALLGLRASQSSQSQASSTPPELGPAREMGYMVYDYSQTTAYISLEDARKRQTIALRSLNLSQGSSALGIMTFHSDQSWPSVCGLVSLEEAQNNKDISRRAIYLL